MTPSPICVSDSIRLKLRFTPFAWAKLHFMRDCVNTEIGGLAVTDPDDYMLVVDILVPPQEVSSVHTKILPGSLSELVADMADPEGEYRLKVDQFMRIWIHTHPGFDPSPSQKDLDTFYGKDNFGSASWGVMFILSSDGRYHCDYRFRDPGGSERVISIEAETVISFDEPAVDEKVRKEWLEEVANNVEETYTYFPNSYGVYHQGIPSGGGRGVSKTSPQTTIVDPYGMWDDDDSYLSYLNGFDPYDHSRGPYSTPTLPRPPDDTEFSLRRDSVFWMMDEDMFVELANTSQESLTLRDVSQELADQLEKCDMVVAAVGKDQVVSFKYETGVGKNKKTMVLTSDELFSLDKPVVHDTEYREILSEVEDKLFPYVSSRDPAVAGTIFDCFDTPIQTLHHWVCYDNMVIYLSIDEISVLESVAAGLTELETAMSELAPMGKDEKEEDDRNPVGFYIGDDEEDEILGPKTIVGDDINDFTDISDAWIDVAQVVHQCLQNGDTVEDIEKGIADLRKKSAEKDKASVFDYVVNYVRSSGYDLSAVDRLEMFGIDVNPTDEPYTASEYLKGE